MMPLTLAAAVLVGMVARVIDGDTILLADNTRIRLAAVDAPEITEPDGVAARAALAAEILGRELVCMPEGTSYNRIVAVCRIGGVDLGEWLIANRHARPACKFGGARYNDVAPLRLRC